MTKYSWHILSNHIDNSNVCYFGLIMFGRWSYVMDVNAGLLLPQNRARLKILKLVLLVTDFSLIVTYHVFKNNYALSATKV